MLAAFCLTACHGLPMWANGDASTHPVPNTAGLPPTDFKVTFVLKNWRVLDVTAPAETAKVLGSLHYTGSIRKNPHVYFMFRTKAFPTYFWLVPVPESPDGTFSGTALRHAEPCTLCTAVGDPHTPPSSVQLIADVEDGYIQKHYILDPLPWWGHFVFSYLDREHRMLYLHNPLFPGFEWKARYPEKNGKWSVSLELMDE